MTYRQLSRYYLIGSTLFFVTIWWLSLRPDASFNAFVPGRHLHLRFHQGGAMAVTHAGPYPKFHIELFRVPAISMVVVKRFPHGSFGALRAGSGDAFPTASGFAAHYAYAMVPIWLAYILVTGAGLVLLSWAGRRKRLEQSRAGAQASAEQEFDAPRTRQI
jgi:hypothetical protein